ncbi:RNA-directed DNA polymerase, eukaryota, nucleotide-binding alpha-beta plait domain protein [Tanacetum coccineum]
MITARDLWKVCNDYGVVVDAFIPYKKSKAGKRFAFVRFMKVDNISPSHPSNANERNSPGSYVSILKSGKMNNVIDERVIWISFEGLPLKVWTHNTFAKVASKWGDHVKWEYLAEKSLFCKRLCVKTKLNEIIDGRFKVIMKGSVYWVRAKETEVYDPFICNDSYESESSDDEEDAEDDGSQSRDKVTADNDVERVSE